MQSRRAFGILRISAGILLIASILAPLYFVPISLDGTMHPAHAWNLAAEDPASAVLLAVAFLGPGVVAILCGCGLQRRWSVLLLLGQFVLLGISVAILLSLAHSTYALLPILGPWLLALIDGSPGAGIGMVLTADGILLLLCLVRAGSQMKVPSS